MQEIIFKIKNGKYCSISYKLSINVGKEIIDEYSILVHNEHRSEKEKQRYIDMSEFSYYSFATIISI